MLCKRKSFIKQAGSLEEVSGKLAVFFEEPLWAGVFECISEVRFSACKVTFGAEPKDYDEK